MNGERKHVTVLFSDLSGYTAMCERLDPEEVKEIMQRIFREISQVVTKYEGFIEKFVGDAVMALFGVPEGHEDDPVRAIRAASEIHALVEAISPQFEERIGQALLMHTGINTGLVVTGEVDLEKGTHGVAGGTVNVASRLSELAKAGEIVVGPDTYRQAEGYFTFESLEPAEVKGKAEPIQVYKVLSRKEEPSKIHRIQGLKADLIGRERELAQLVQAVTRLRKGKGTIFSICGDAGTGKSRLIEEFKATLDLKEIQWRQGHAYAYAQNIPYFPLIDLLNRAWKIEEGDPPETVRSKIESGIEKLVGNKEDVVPYVGSLYTLSYPEIEGVSPEFWRACLQHAIQTIFAALTRRAPTVICIEDVHWADPSSLDLIRSLVSEFRYPTLLLCVYRPPLSLFTSDELSGIEKLYHEVRLQDLSSLEAQDMMESLLKTQSVPTDLRRFIQEKVEGNPFYIEEVINTLIESGTLAPDHGSWRLTRSIKESDISSTINGIISARVDRLDKETKRILQEASVIGRAFLYEILKRITELKERVDRCLSTLEQLDLIRKRCLQPDLEYVFKHALIQEVVYSGLLKKERRKIHERIALNMEELFRDRLSEFSETLAFHFKQGQSIHKAIDYLVKSGEKSLARYSLDESHQHFKEAFDLLSRKPDKTDGEKGVLIDVLIDWAYVFYYRGDSSGLENLLNTHLGLAESLKDKARLGMFYAWLGHALFFTEKFQDSHQYLRKALRLGEENKSRRIIGHACAWLTWTCAELGLLDEAIHFGRRAQKISRGSESDLFLYFISLSGLGHAYWYRGERRNALEAGKALLDHGKKHSNIRSLVWGHYIMGWSHFTAGDFSSAIGCFERAMQVSADPYYSQFPRVGLVYSYVSLGQFQKAEESLRDLANYTEKFGIEILRTPAQGLWGLVSIGKGRLSRGIKILHEVRRVWLEKERKSLYAASEYMLGKVYMEISQRGAPVKLSTITRNIGFLARNILLARRKAEVHFNESIRLAKEIGAKSTLGRAYLDLGLLHRTRGKRDQAEECISTAADLFEQCGAYIYLRQARKALQDIG